MTDLYTEHIEEIEFLWTQRADILFANAFFPSDLHEHDKRIESHVRAVLVPGDDVVPMIDPCLDEDDAGLVFAAAYPLLRLQRGALSERLLSLYESAEGDRRNGFEDALKQGPISQIQSKIERHLAPDNPVLALAAVRILAFHDSSWFRPDVISGTARNNDRDIRLSAWQTAIYGQGISEATYAQGLRDADPDVSASAAVAAAWAGQPDVLIHLRDVVHSVAPQSWDAACLLAVLGDESDLNRLRPFASDEQFGPARLRLLGRVGHPDGVDDILDGIKSNDPATAEAAGIAFTRITGIDIASGERAAGDPSSPTDDVDVEFASEHVVPDVDRAHREWERLKPSFANGTRWCRGLNVTAGIDGVVLAQCDLESRRDLCLRSAYYGKQLMSAIELERLQ
jgi:uncharacterized protein (TIGR02270 family)